MPSHLRPLLGIAALLAIGVLFSANRRRIRPRVVLPALACQMLAGLLMLGVAQGRDALAAVARGVSWVISFGHAGIDFVFGALAGPDLARLVPSAAFIFALHVLPQIIYLSALISVLYHYKVMQLIARMLGGLLTRTLGVSSVEGFSAVMAMFLGQTEVPIAIRPYLAGLSQAELFSALSSGTASISMSMLGAYAGLGVPMDDLLAASFMAIPGGLLYAKILMPASQVHQHIPPAGELDEIRSANLFDALAVGASNGLKVVLSVTAMLIAFISAIALLDALLGLSGRQIGLPGLSLSGAIGFLLKPLVWLLGTPWDQCQALAGIIGTKIVVNEFVAYGSLSPLIHAHALDARVLAIASFAVCGFANLSSIGILIGAFGSQCPERRQDVAILGGRAVLAGTLSNLTSAAIAGLVMS